MNKKIGYGLSLFNEYSVNSLFVDQYNYVNLTIEKGININKIKITVEEAVNIGFIDFSKLEKYCK